MDVRLEFYFGMDGISLVLVVLTAVLMVSSVLVSWEAIRTQTAEFYACLLLLETGLLGAFCAFDLLLFYVFFEVTLIPLFFLIGIWGGPERQRAAYKFFLYTLAGSALTLVGLIALVLCMLERGGGLATPFSIPDLARELGENGGLPEAVQWWIFLGLSAGFVIKVPLFPFHTWLPLAHTEAPTAGSVVLAGVLLKLGTYGFLRLCLPFLPQATWHLGVPLVGTLAVIGIVYGALCSLAQQDIKKLVAYSSVSHLGFCMLGMFALNAEGISGSVLQMVNHGLSTGALFLLVGMIYERYHTRRMGALGGLAGRLPLLACGMVFICLSSVGLPGLNGFVGEWLALSGMFRANRLFAVVGATGIILGAWYLLSMLQRSFFGPLKEPDGHRAVVTDLQGREIAALAPIVVLCLWIGIYPRPVLDAIRPDVEAIARVYQAPPAMSLAGRAQVWDDSASRLWTVVSDRPDRMENPAPGGSNSEEEAR
jgi:NADH-quinone oxidoreductase subunit M